MNHDMLAQELIPYADGLGAALAQDTNELLARKIIETARFVTGLYSAETAIATIKDDAATQERFRKAMAFLLAIESRARAPEVPAPAIVGEKDLLQSKTTWGVLVPIIAILTTHYGFDLGDQQAWVDALSGLVGAALVLYGRVKAIKQITSIAGASINAKS